jgi:secondary thiamine-phosphate synthase enzyme
MNESSTGGLVVRGDAFVVPTRERIDIVDLTDRLREFVRASGVQEGLLSVWALHTTCALFVNENQKALLADVKRVLDQLVARDDNWLHNDPAHSDCDRVNADSHLRAMLLGHSLTLQVSGGDIVLGQWQRTLLAELDGPRERTLRAQIWGIAR